MTKAQRKSRTVSEIFTEQKEARPEVAFSDIALDVTQSVGYRINTELIRQYHHGTTTKRPNLAVIAAIADFYGLKASDLPDDIIDMCTRSRAVFERLGVPSTPPGTRTRNLQIRSAA